MADPLAILVNVVSGENTEIADNIETTKSAITDVVAESDDELVEKYLEQGELSPEDFEKGLRQGIRSGTIVPILAGSVSKQIGLEELLQVITDDFPSPLERKIVAHNGSDDEIIIKASPDEPFLGQVFR